ncbi:dimethylhistidine N-methyltransferase [Synechococcus sp. Minos11]|uniref:L-histidine N(alpha)-methyltransferase n=1 Tax=Synechococcus sp. Minos11 TaxID=221341 RepID=UPI0016455C29|nr:L-histidine N(alpha)-methyltransferase [Synechococcus sp. Minos11]QNJ07611.1 dimethylhistidine N-methyltransferase [Synechococcus sp. Minos11]
MSPHATAQHFELLDLHPAPTDVSKAVIDGLKRTPKQLPAWLLYDRQGSALFDAICQQPEYTLTRLEKELIGSQAQAIAEALPAEALVVEFGAGSAEKVSPLLGAMDKPSYLAIDISAEHLQEAGTRLQERHPSIPMLGICADYSQPLELPLPKAWQSKPMVGFFPGSSLGNFEPDAAINFLQRIRQLLGENAQLLIGIDQPREPSLLEAAYDDNAGVSAAFAKNLLLRLQRDLAIELDPEPFTYQAAWEPKHQRIAMTLVANSPQTWTIGASRIPFAAGEALITEYSYKYAPSDFLALAAQAGWQGSQRWSDADDHFSLHLLTQGDDARMNA